MAVVATHHQTTTAQGTSVTTTSIPAASGELIIVLGWGSRNGNAGSSAAATISMDSTIGLSTAFASLGSGSGQLSGKGCAGQAWWGIANGTAGTVTLTVTNGASDSVCALSVFRVTGADTAAPDCQTLSAFYGGGGGGGSYSATLVTGAITPTPISTTLVLCAVAHHEYAVTPIGPTGTYAEISDVSVDSTAGTGRGGGGPNYPAGCNLHVQTETAMGATARGWSMTGDAHWTVAFSIGLRQSSGTDHTRALTETFGTLDSHLRAFGLAVTDSVTGTDSLGAATARTMIDTAGGTDAPVASGGFVRDQTDSAGFADGPAVGLNRPVTDTAGLGDTFGQLAAFAPSVTDEAGVVEALSSGTERVIPDGVGALDATAGGFGVGVVDGGSWADTFEAASGAERVVIESVAATDNQTGVSVAARDLLDPGGGTDSTGRAATVERSPIDTADVTDVVVPVRDIVLLVTDATGAVDAPVGESGTAGTVTDLAGLLDGMVQAGEIARQVADLLGTLDTASQVVAIDRDVIDSASVSDVAGVAVVFDRAVADTSAVADSADVSGSGAATSTVLDLSGLGDTATLTVEAVRDLLDTLGTGDTTEAVSVVGRFLSDIAGSSDTVGVLVALLRAVTDGLAVTDSVAVVLMEASPPSWTVRAALRGVAAGRLTRGVAAGRLTRGVSGGPVSDATP